jgi:hypothetical protein
LDVSSRTFARCRRPADEVHEAVAPHVVGVAPLYSSRMSMASA